MNVKDHEDQEDLEVSEKAEGWHSFQHLSYIAENRTMQRRKHDLYVIYIQHVWDNYLYVPNMYQQTKI